MSAPRPRAPFVRLDGCMDGDGPYFEVFAGDLLVAEFPDNAIVDDFRARLSAAIEAEVARAVAEEHEACAAVVIDLPTCEYDNANEALVEVAEIIRKRAGRGPAGGGGGSGYG